MEKEKLLIKGTNCNSVGYDIASLINEGFEFNLKKEQDSIIVDVSRNGEFMYTEKNNVDLNSAVINAIKALKGV